MSHIRVISKATPKSADAVQDLICEMMIVMTSLFNAKNINLPFLNMLGGEEGKCQPVTIEDI